ncbi:MAG: tyrosine-type recombinase/integrase, partial [Oscillospiraceae bacterium]
MLYSDLLAAWWEEYKLSLRENTIHKKEDEMRVHILPGLGGHVAAEITAQTIKGYIDLKLAHGSPLRHPGGLAPATVVCHLHIINSSFAWGVANKMVPLNPCAKIKYPAPQRRSIVTFTPTEIAQLIAAAKPPWFADLLLLAAQTGMRKGELYGLQWGDVNISGGWLDIFRTVGAYKPGQTLIGPPKTKKSERRVLLDKASIDMLSRRQLDKRFEWV